MPRRTASPAHRDQLRLAAKRFRDHEGISFGGLEKWYFRFEECDSELALKILRSIRYYSGLDIRVSLEALVTSVFERLHGVQRRQIFFVPVGGPGESGTVLARALRDVPGIHKDRIVYMAEIERISPEQISAIVFVDDFSGTGKTLETWWQNVETMILPKAATILVALLVVNHSARPVIENFARLVRVHELREEDNVLSATSRAFDGPEKELVLKYCRQTKCPKQYLKGFGECALLLAFRHGCPNNSLPILWFPDKWPRLFRRSAI